MIFPSQQSVACDVFPGALAESVLVCGDAEELVDYAGDAEHVGVGLHGDAIGVKDLENPGRQREAVAVGLVLLLDELAYPVSELFVDSVSFHVLPCTTLPMVLG